MEEIKVVLSFIRLVQKSLEKSPSEVHPPARHGAAAARRTAEHNEARRRTVQQSSAPRFQSSETLRDKRRSEESSRAEGRARKCSS